MKDKLRSYVEKLFEDAPKSSKTIELKEEILQNVMDKYNDMISEDKTEEAAYNIAIANIGDVGELISSINEDRSKKVSTDDIDSARKKSALLVSGAVVLYISCLVPVFIFQNVNGVIGMFLFIAFATGMLVYNECTKPTYTKKDETVVEEFKAWKEQQSEKTRAIKAISSALWAIVTTIYIIISFLTGAWYITWVIFLIGTAIENIIKAVFELKNNNSNKLTKGDDI